MVKIYKYKIIPIVNISILFRPFRKTTTVSFDNISLTGFKVESHGD